MLLKIISWPQFVHLYAHNLEWPVTSEHLGSDVSAFSLLCFTYVTSVSAPQLPFWRIANIQSPHHGRAICEHVWILCVCRLLRQNFEIWQFTEMKIDHFSSRGLKVMVLGYRGRSCGRGRKNECVTGIQGAYTVPTYPVDGRIETIEPVLQKEGQDWHYINSMCTGIAFENSIVQKIIDRKA